MDTINRKEKIEKRIKGWTLFFIVSLAVSGLTAFPLESELSLLNELSFSYLDESNILRIWIVEVHNSIQFINEVFPYLSYGTDWLAFAHLVIAVFFIGVYLDPVRNQWTIISGMIACVAVIPLAFIAGEVRGIPIFWRLIDCSFGVIGIMPLMYVYYLSEKLKKIKEGVNEAVLV